MKVYCSRQMGTMGGVARLAEIKRDILVLISSTTSRADRPTGRVLVRACAHVFSLGRAPASTLLHRIYIYYGPPKGLGASLS